MATLQEAIADAKIIKERNNLPFATIWKTGKSFGFNFEPKVVGFTTTDFGVKRTVIAVV